MNESILTSIKQLLGIIEEDVSFDGDIIIHINAVITILKQLGIGSDFFYVKNKDDKWSDYISESDDLNLIKTYIYMKVRMIFDTPTGSAMEAFNKIIEELEWRINVNVDPIPFSEV